MAAVLMRGWFDVGASVAAGWLACPIFNNSSCDRSISKGQTYYYLLTRMRISVRKKKNPTHIAIA
jgi:hypothetical protein